MAERTLKEIVEAMQGEVKWFQSEAERAALRGTQSVNFAIKVNAMHDQAKYLAIREKLAEWTDKLSSLLEASAGRAHIRDTKEGSDTRSNNF